MVSTDPIADLSSRIRNAISVPKNEISLPHSQIKEKIAQVLVESGFLQGVKSQDVGGRKLLIVIINLRNENAKLSSIKRLSKPGQRHYVKADEIPTVRRGRGIVIVSTSGGIMTGADARAKGLGGELIVEVY